MIVPAEVDALVEDQFPAAFAAGYRCVELGERWALARWEHDPAVLRPGGYVSGLTLFGRASLSVARRGLDTIGAQT